METRISSADNVFEAMGLALIAAIPACLVGLMAAWEFGRHILYPLAALSDFHRCRKWAPWVDVRYIRIFFFCGVLGVIVAVSPFVIGWTFRNLSIFQVWLLAAVFGAIYALNGFFFFNKERESGFLYDDLE